MLALSFSDLALARRLERAEGLANAHFVEARAAASPGVGARWIESAGALAMFDGIESPCTQTFALGILQPAASGDFDELETFFRDRGAPVFHEVSPLADTTVFQLLHARGYKIVEFTSVMWRPIARGGGVEQRQDERIAARPVGEDEHDLWATTVARGWSHLPELTAFLHELAPMSRHRKNHIPFIAEADGQPIAAGGLAIEEGVALLAGASTIPEARRQGAQRALLEARLKAASDQGCDVAMMGALPGSDSQRNAERQGFRIAYTRIKWRLVC
jgi:GNAT superfamily N-acetyltransferase